MNSGLLFFCSDCYGDFVRYIKREIPSWLMDTKLSLVVLSPTKRQRWQVVQDIAELAVEAITSVYLNQILSCQEEIKEH